MFSMTSLYEAARSGGVFCPSTFALVYVIDAVRA